ncbi:unnamed protein product [Adineta ricciae]|uniref:Uncharacterized protein n=1 Tax=Adineta ricciae TaxID=249248 RepID=A0A813MD56_ADIRI|nr:unnamed protein product [Adineta ricciae]
MDVPVKDSHDYLFKILCIGEANVGKTTFLHQYIHDNFANFRSTVGIDVFEKHITGDNDQRILLQLWDTAGQERYRSLTKSLFRDKWLTYIDAYTRVDDEICPPVLLVGNKIDLVTNRIVDTIRAQRLANELRISYIETSAVTGTNVQETFRVLIKDIFRFMDASMQKFYPKSPVLNVLTGQDKRRKRSSVKLLHKLSQTKKRSCFCT